MYWIIIAFALLPIVLLFIYMWVKDMRQPEPIKWLLKALGFGVLSALLVISVSMYLPSVSVTSLGTAFLKAFANAAIPEESAKMLMLWLLLRKNPYYDERLDGIVYAACVSLGFAALENVSYLMSGAADGSWVSTGITRAIFAVPGHFFFGVLMGFFYGMASFGETRHRTRNMCLAWLAPVLAHGIYDGILFSMGTVPPYIAGILLIVFIIAFGRLRRYSVRLITQHQQDDATQPTQTA